MRKILSFFAFVAIVLTFAACGGNNAPEIKDFTIEMVTLTEQNASFTVTPLDQNADYFWFVYPKCLYEDCLKRGTVQSEDKFVTDFLASWAEPEIYWQYDKSIHGKKGTATIPEEFVLMSTGDEYNLQNLCPNCDFRIAVCKIDADKKRVGKISYLPFKTLMPEGYVDLGLNSGSDGALWNCNYVFENGQAKYYTYNEAIEKSLNSEDYEEVPFIFHWKKLMEMCDLTWTDDLSSFNDDIRYAGVKGYVATSKINGNRIYLPALGGKNKSGSKTGVGTVSVYWARDTHTDDVDSYAWWLPKSGNYGEQIMPIENSFSLCLICPTPASWYLGFSIVK